MTQWNPAGFPAILATTGYASPRLTDLLYTIAVNDFGFYPFRSVGDGRAWPGYPPVLASNFDQLIPLGLGVHSPPRSIHGDMKTLEFLARLVALVPPPRYPLVRYHGVLAPQSAWRKHVVPRPPTKKRVARAECAAGRQAAESSRPRPSRRDARRADRPSVAGQGTAADLVPSLVQSPRLTSPRADARPDVDVAHDVITVRHRGRLLGGALLATSPRVPWADLLRRTHGVDALVCPRCDGRLRVLAAITAPDTSGAILRALGVDDSVAPTRSPLPRARAPTAQLELRFAGDQAGES